MKKDYRTIGKNIPRIGAVERLKGHPLFSADLDLEQPLTLKALRSTKAHARILRIHNPLDLLYLFLLAPEVLLYLCRY